MTTYQNIADITPHTSRSAEAVLRRLATVEPVPVPEGEPGVTLQGERPAGRARKYIPVLSLYLDLQPQVQGAQPAVRPGSVILRERLRQIEHTFLPRGAALQAIRDDIEGTLTYLSSQVSHATHGIALFVSGPHRLFEVLLADSPFESQVIAGAIPDLFQLARVLADQDVTVVALLELNAARLFLLQRGGLRELYHQVDDPKYYHLVHGANAMSQAHYQRHALQKRAEFAAEVSHQVEELVRRARATQVILAGEVEAIPLLRQALSPHLAALIHEVHLPLTIDAPADAVLEDIKPLLNQARAEEDRSLLERLLEAIQSDGLGLAGLTPTQDALARGQVETLILMEDKTVPPKISEEVRSDLIQQAARTDAKVAMAEAGPALKQLGGVGALLRYRLLAL